MKRVHVPFICGALIVLNVSRVLTAADPEAADPATWLPLALLQTLEADVRGERQGTVEAAVSQFPGSVETLLLALFTEGYQDDLWNRVGQSFGPLDPAPAHQLNSSRSLGVAQFPGGALPEVTVTKAGNRYESYGDYYTSPLLLDLNFDGLPGVGDHMWEPHPGLDLTRVLVADINGDGFAELTEWVDGTDGLLVDPEDPSKVTSGVDGLGWNGPLSGRDLVGTAEGYRDGFEKLLRRDEDSDGEISQAELDGLFVWTDGNRDAQIQGGELSRLAELGITVLRLPHGQPSGSFELGGRTGTLWDWWPSYALARKLPLDPFVGPGTDTFELKAEPQPPRQGEATDCVPDAAGWIALDTAGMHGASLVLAGVAPDGSRVILFDRGASTEQIAAGTPTVMWSIQPGTPAFTIIPTLVPVVSVQQLVFDTDASVIIVGDNGGKLLRVNCATGAVGVLHKPVPGEPGVRAGLYAWRSHHGSAENDLDEDAIFLTAEFYDAEQVVEPQTFVRFTGRGDGATLEAVSPVEAVRARVRELGEIRMEYFVTPDLAYFVIKTKETGNSALGLCRAGKASIIDQPVRLGGIAASGSRVLYFKDRGDVLDRAADVLVYDGATEEYFNLGSGDYCYPYLKDEGTVAVVAGIDWATGAMDFYAADVGGGTLECFFQADGIGQVRVSENGRTFAYLGPQGLNVVSIPRVIPQQPYFVRGNANGDDREDIGDAIFVLSYLFASGSPPACFDAADTNDDGQVDIGDAINFLSFLFAEGSAPPEPYPDCGLDPTEDGLTCRSFPACDGAFPG